MSMLKRFLREARFEWGWLGLLILALICAAVLEVSAPLYLGKIVDAILQGLAAKSDIMVIMKSIDYIVVLLIAFYAGHALFTYFGEYMMASISQNIVLRLRNKMSEHLYKLPMAYFHEHQRGDVLSRLTSDLDSIGETVQEGVPGLISALIGIIGAVAMMLYLSPLLAGCIILVISLGLVLLYITSKKARLVYLHNQEALGAFNSGMEEVIVGKPIIQAFGLEPAMADNVKLLNTELRSRLQTASFMSKIIEPLVKFLNQLSYVIVAVLGCLLVLEGSISLGNIQAFFLYVGQVSDPISRSSYIITKFQETAAALQRVYEVLDTPLELDSGTKELSHTDKSASGTIEFKKVSFGYTPDHLLMKDLSLVIPGGHLVAIVGPTGAGKTTLANLIMRYYEVSAGEICIDGINIQALSRESLHHKVSMVLQDAWIFTGTIAENIGYGNSKATREDIERVAKLAMADFFIRTLPKGYDTVLKQGGEDLSQGQRQLITIARAFLADPDILILDEATANVDTRTEVEVQKAMNMLLKGRTSIVIAHRLSTIKNADLLLVVQQGNIVEQGSHQGLLAAGGYYKLLYDNYVRGMST